MTNNPPDYPLDANAIGNREFILGILRQNFIMNHMSNFFNLLIICFTCECDRVSSCIVS